MDANVSPSAFNSVEFCTKMTTELDKKMVQSAQTGIFVDNNLRGKFVGAKTVIIPTMGMSGLGDYDRDEGHARGGVSVSGKPFTLDMDRGICFQIDEQEADESGIPDLAGQVMGEFVRTKVVPEVDAYTLSKLAGVAIDKEQIVTGTIDTDIYKMINKAKAKVQNAIGYDEELVCFVDGTVFAALKNSSEISRHLVLNDFKKGELHTQVTCLDDMPILPVQDSRMKTGYTFHDGSADEFGFEPLDTAKSIGFLLLPKRCASLIKKTEQIRTFTPRNNQKAVAWRLDYRLYYDVVVKDSLVEGIYVHTYG